MTAIALKCGTLQGSIDLIQLSSPLIHDSSPLIHNLQALLRGHANVEKYQAINELDSEIKATGFTSTKAWLFPDVSLEGIG